MKKVMILLLLISFTFLLSSCGPSTVPVEWIDVECSSGEVNIGDIVDLTIVFLPANATDQGYSLALSDNTVATLLPNDQVEATNIGYTMVEVTSDDGGFTNTCHIYITGP